MHRSGSLAWMGAAWGARLSCGGGPAPVAWVLTGRSRRGGWAGDVRRPRRAGRRGIGGAHTCRAASGEGARLEWGVGQAQAVGLAGEGALTCEVGGGGPGSRAAAGGAHRRRGARAALWSLVGAASAGWVWCCHRWGRALWSRVGRCRLGAGWGRVPAHGGWGRRRWGEWWGGTPPRRRQDSSAILMLMV